MVVCWKIGLSHLYSSLPMISSQLPRTILILRTVIEVRDHGQKQNPIPERLQPVVEFLKDYGTEAQCENALFTWRFPNGFVCPECANKVTVHPDGIDRKK